MLYQKFIIMAKKNDEIETKVHDSQETVKLNIVQVMYVGPSVPSLGLVQNRVYLGDTKDVFGLLKEKYPLVMQLVVPVDDSVRARVEVDTPGTARYMAAQEIMGGEL